MSCSPQPCAGPFLGKYRGKVLANLDPLFLGRLLVEVPRVPAAVSNWALPCAPYAGPGVGFFAIPPVGADVWVEFEGGDPGYPIWVGGFWTEGSVPLGEPLPEQKILKTDFVTMTLDDRPGVGGFTVEYFVPGEMDAPFLIRIDATGIRLSAPPAEQSLVSEEGITLAYPEALVEMTAEDVTVTVPPTEISLTAEAASVEAPDVSVAAEGAAEVTGGGDVTLTAGGVMEASAGADLSIEAGAAVEVSAGLDLALEAGAAVEVSAVGDVAIEALAVETTAVDIALTGAAVEVTAAGIALTGLAEVTGDLLLDGQQVLAI